MKIKTYTWDNIQTVYKRFHENPHSVVYSIDNGLTWQSPEMDTGKWGSGLDPKVRWNMKFAFLQCKQKKQKSYDRNDEDVMYDLLNDLEDL